jgi:hypothetical protein
MAEMRLPGRPLEMSSEVLTSYMNLIFYLLKTIGHLNNEILNYWSSDELHELNYLIIEGYWSLGTEMFYFKCRNLMNSIDRLCTDALLPPRQSQRAGAKKT